METFMKYFQRKSDCFYFPGDCEIAGHMNFVKAFRGNSMMDIFTQGGAYEVIVSRNLINFTLSYPSYQTDKTGISSESILWRL